MLRPAAVMVAALLLAGCVPNEPVVTPPPEPQATPIFASDEDALAAATKAYAKYLEVSDAIRADGGRNPERIASVVSKERLQDELQGFEDLAAGGRSTTGGITIDSARLQSYVDDSPSSAVVAIYACLDSSNVKLFDSTGKPVPLANQQRRQLFEARFVSSINNSKSLILTGSELWSGQSDC